MALSSADENFPAPGITRSITNFDMRQSFQYRAKWINRHRCPGGGFLLPQSEKSILKILPAPHTSHPVFQLANPTAQQFVIPGSNVQVSPSSVVQADPLGPVATTVGLLRPGTYVSPYTAPGNGVGVVRVHVAPPSPERATFNCGVALATTSPPPSIPWKRSRKSILTTPDVGVPWGSIGTV